jgi:hypothetical protein
MVGNSMQSSSRLGFCVPVLAWFLLPVSALANPTSVYREIRSIEISTQGKGLSKADAELCSGFKLASQKVKKILESAREIDIRFYTHELDFSPCSVEGQVTLRNGLKGKWQVQMGGGIRIEFEDQHVMLLHCKNCGKPFVD